MASLGFESALLAWSCWHVTPSRFGYSKSCTSFCQKPALTGWFERVNRLSIRTPARKGVLDCDHVAKPLESSALPTASFKIVLSQSSSFHIYGWLDVSSLQQTELLCWVFSAPASEPIRLRRQIWIPCGCLGVGNAERIHQRERERALLV